MLFIIFCISFVFSQDATGGCGDGQYMANDGTCQPCDSNLNCVTCFSADKCSSCNEAEKYYLNLQQKTRHRVEFLLFNLIFAFRLVAITAPRAITSIARAIITACCAQ